MHMGRPKITAELGGVKKLQVMCLSSKEYKEGSINCSNQEMHGQIHMNHMLSTGAGVFQKVQRGNVL